MLLIQPINHFETGIPLAGGRISDNIFNAMALHLEPALTVDTTVSFQPIPGDSTGAVFGFKYRNFSVGNIPINDIHRFYLNKNKVPQGSTIKVLSDVWDGTILRWEDTQGKTSHVIIKDINSDNDIATFHHFNGKKWYLSINLKALSETELNNHLNDTILIIRVPYTLSRHRTDSLDTVTGSGYIKFSRLPRNDNSVSEIRSNILETSEFRGMSKPLITLDGLCDTMFITGNMLKYWNMSSHDNNITLSGYFEASGEKDTLDTNRYTNNPCFQNETWNNYSKLQKFISKVDLEVFYCGKVDVAIDWIRFETPNAQKLFRGFYDQTIDLSIKKTLEEVHEHPTHPIIHRFYGNDEVIPMEWFSMWYYNKFVDGLLSSESYISGNITARHYQYSMDFKEVWTGDDIIYRPKNGVPYYNKGYADGDKVVYSHNAAFLGYKGNNVIDHNDTLNSAYETFLYNTQGKDVSIPVANQGFSIFEYDIWNSPYFYWNISPQYCIERCIHRYFYKLNSMLYAPEPWWANIWNTFSSWSVSNNQFSNVLNPSGRPITGEEARLQMSLPLLLGAKGFQYWFKTAGFITSNNTWEYTGLQSINGTNISNLTGDELIKSDLIGGDYIYPGNNLYALNSFYSTLSPFNYTDLYLNPNEKKLYTGIKSTRYEMMKWHKIIRRLEYNKTYLPRFYPHDLVDLQLAAWYGKGFTTMYSQRKELDAIKPQILNEFIITPNVRTAKLYQPNHTPPSNFENVSNSFFVNTWESLDSSFFDITLLYPKDQSISDSIFYLGVQNRRTDPLIWDTAASRLRFYTTVEFEDSCFSNNYQTRSYFQDYFWKRLGSRAIKIPLSYKFAPIYSLTPFGILIEEVLGNDNQFNKANNKWRDEKYCHKVNFFYPHPDFFYGDSVYTSPSDYLSRAPSIFTKLLPGEGKIFKIQKYYYPSMYKCPDKGELAMFMVKDTCINDTCIYSLYFSNSTGLNLPNFSMGIGNSSLREFEISYNDGTNEYYYANFANHLNEDSTQTATYFLPIHPEDTQGDIKKVGTLKFSEGEESGFTYTLLSTDNHGNFCDRADTIKILNHHPKINLNEAEITNNISIFPNPMYNQATIEININDHYSSDVVIYDIFGIEKKIFKNFKLNKGKNKIELNLINYSSGTYYIKVFMNDQILSNKFIVIK